MIYIGKSYYVLLKFWSQTVLSYSRFQKRVANYRPWVKSNWVFAFVNKVLSNTQLDPVSYRQTVPWLVSTTSTELTSWEKPESPHDLKYFHLALYRKVCHLLFQVIKLILWGKFLALSPSKYLLFGSASLTRQLECLQGLFQKKTTLLIVIAR